MFSPFAPKIEYSNVNVIVHHDACLLPFRTSKNKRYIKNSLPQATEWQKGKYPLSVPGFEPGTFCVPKCKANVMTPTLHRLLTNLGRYCKLRSITSCGRDFEADIDQRKRSWRLECGVSICAMSEEGAECLNFGEGGGKEGAKSYILHCKL